MTSGYPHISTPAFDELATAGMSVENAATTPGSSSEGFVELVDLFPTLADWADETASLGAAFKSTNLQLSGDFVV